MKSILVVEDERIVALSLKHELEQHGFNVVGLAASEDEAVSLFAQHLPNLVLMDINLEAGGSGIEAAKKLNEIKRVPIIYVTAYANDDIVKKANAANPIGYIVKPYNIREIKAVIETALQRFSYETDIKHSEAKLKIALEAAELSVWEFNPSESHFVFSSNEAFKGYFDNSATMEIQKFLDLVDPRDREKVERIIYGKNKVNDVIRVSLPHKPGEYWFEVYSSDIQVEGDKIRIGAMKDVTSLEAYLKELKLSNSIYQQLADGIIVFDEEFKLTRANPAFCKLIGYEPNQLVGKTYFELVDYGRGTDTPVNDLKLLEGHRELTFKTASKDIFYALVNGKLVTHKSDRNELVMIVTDITELKLAEKKLKYQAYRDELTGMYNRTFMNRAFNEPKQHFDTGMFTLLFIDLDSFKLINDTFGHDLGDAVLVEVSWRLKQLFRSSDRLIRHGGDEFVVMLDGQLNATEIQRVTESIHDIVRRPISMEPHTLKVTCSIGAAEWDPSVQDTSELLKRADIAMYEAKNMGKNSYQLYETNMGNTTKYHLFLEQGLSNAITNNELKLWFQPVVNSAGQVVSAEGLCRWFDKDAGFVSPEDFITVAESNWLIFPLGENMLRLLCRAQHELKKFEFSDIKLALNLSAKQLGHPTLPETFQKILLEEGASPDLIVLEITETALAKSGCSVNNVKELRRMGFTIALDDFGRGYSSLEKLQTYEIDVIKLDKVFVDTIPSSIKANTVCHYMVEMAQQLGFSVIVEGIETQEQMLHFADLSNVKQQGYFHAKPMQLGHFVEFIKSNKQQVS